MTKRLAVATIFTGFLSWLLPFAVSFLFYKPGGELVVAYSTFKSIITVTGVVTGCYLLFRYFNMVNNHFIRTGVIAGLAWFAINIILNALVLIPKMKTSFLQYFMSIGISYISIPVISSTMGCLLTKKLQYPYHE
jgi:hypothetical protein